MPTPEDLNKFKPAELSEDKSEAKFAEEESSFFAKSRGDLRGGKKTRDDFHGRAKELNKPKIFLTILLILLFSTILATPFWYSFFFKFVECYSQITCTFSPSGENTTPHKMADLYLEKYIYQNENAYLWVYFSGKIFLLFFLTSIFAWISRIFSQIRRLQITYYDKALIANTFPDFFIEGKENKVLEENALCTLFEPSLQQAEKCVQTKKDDSQPNIINVIDALGKITKK